MSKSRGSGGEIPNQSLTVSGSEQSGTQEPTGNTMKPDLPLASDDGWDMSPRRESDIMLEMPTSFEPIEPDRPLPSARGVLSPAEVEALLRPNLDDMPEPDPEPEVIDDRALPELGAPAARPADPARPVDISDDARRLAARLTLALRDGCGLRAAATVARCASGQFEQGLMGYDAGKGSAVACFASPEGEIAAMLVLSAPLANALIETACGGQPDRNMSRQLTVLDTALLEALVRPLGAAIASGLRFSRIETDTGFAAALASPGEASILDLDVRVESTRTTARLILAVDDLFDQVPQDRQLPAPEAAASAAPPAPSGVTAILTARVASLSVPLSRLADLKPGSTLLLGIPADQPIELLTGGRDGTMVAEGEVGRKGNRMALRISRRGPLLRRS